MLKKIKFSLLPVILIALTDLLFRPLEGESFGRGMNLVLEWLATTVVVWALTLFTLTEIASRYWKTKNLCDTYLEYKVWFYIAGLGIAYPIVAGCIIRLKN